MSYSLQIQHEAVVEAHKIFEWYESKQQGLGFEFVESLERAYYDISGGANYYDYIDNKKIYRRILLDRFPCMVIYEIENNKDVIIVSVRYGNENPEKRKQYTQ